MEKPEFDLVAGVLAPPNMTREQAIAQAQELRRQLQMAEDRLRRWEAYLLRRWGGREG